MLRAEGWLTAPLSLAGSSLTSMMWYLFPVLCQHSILVNADLIGFDRPFLFIPGHFGTTAPLCKAPPGSPGILGSEFENLTPEQVRGSPYRV